MIMAAGQGKSGRDPWAIVLAGGGGSRLRGCTVDSTGHHVPKQYCVVDGTHTLLQLAISRAKRVVEREHVLVVVSSQHRQWWEPQLEGLLPPSNIVAQPLSRGTAVGVLLPLLQVLARDPEAHVVLLPADHYFRDEERLARSIRSGLAHTYEEASTLVLLGIRPDIPTSDFGYIVPLKPGASGPVEVTSFVEKPPPSRARQLVDHGALWNTLILAARGRQLLRAIRERFPHTVDALRVATVREERPDRLARTLSAVYPALSTADLSKDVLEPGNHAMVVVAAGAVGWAELGTPDRVLRFWDELHPDTLGRTTASSSVTAARHAFTATTASASGRSSIRLAPPG